VTKLCWDSNVFISWIEKKNAAELAVLQPIVTAAQNGQIRIVASYLAFAEVVRCNGDQPMSEEEEERIATFFKHPFIEIRPLDRAITILARSFCRASLIERQEARAKHKTGRLIEPPKIEVNDAIHVATAIHYGCDVLQTIDDGLKRFSEKFGVPKLRIEHPSYSPPPPKPLPPTSGQKSAVDFGGDEGESDRRWASTTTDPRAIRSGRSSR
jgi:predicted nucleic acid-binding protein